MARQHCSCSCGEVGFDVVGLPLFRIICHCTICQRFSGAEFADVIVYDAASVERPEIGTVRFDTYKSPPNVQRGKCAKCDKSAIEVFESPLFPSLTMVPSDMFGSDAELPTPSAHIFYEKRVSDAGDDRPKHEGFLLSQFAFGKYLLTAKLFAKNTHEK